MARKQYRLDKPEGCDIDGCTRPHYSNGLCVPHWHRRQKYGDPLAGPPLRKPRGDIGKPRPQHGQGLTDEYFLNHKKVREARGPAWQHQCEHCGVQAVHWAMIKGTTGASPDDYMPLCRSCHGRYDDTGSWLVRPKGETHHSAKLTEEQVREIRARGSEDRSVLAREFGVTRQLIYEIHIGSIWKAVGGPITPVRHRSAPKSAEAGQRFGKLTVSGSVMIRESAGRRRKIIPCVCDCGTSTVANLDNLLSGTTKSCGCLRGRPIAAEGGVGGCAGTPGMTLMS